MNDQKIKVMGFESASEKNWVSAKNVLTVFLGENGSGKSRLLATIARDSIKRGMNTLIIANTPYDQFKRIDGKVHRLLVRDGASLPEKTLKTAISNAVNQDEISLKRISRVLQYCRYQPDIGVRVRVTRSKQRSIDEIELLSEVSESDAQEVLSLCHVLLRNDISNQIIWIDFDRANPDYSYRSILPKVFRWEALLKRMKIISGVGLYLKRDDETIPLKKGSSGELTLIATMAFVATTFRDESTICIDEPENSLHPRWQREYLSILSEVLKYRTANIFIATHSPLILAEMDAGGLDDRFVSGIVLARGGDGASRLAPDSVEGILVEAFRTVTPANHYLSEVLTGLLDEVDHDASRLAHVKERINEFRSGLPDQKQEAALSAVENMAEEIASGGGS